MMSSIPSEKQDRYEQLLTKYDWHAPHPPRGYQYGIGRGARPFSTTAELSVGVNVGADTREESDFFRAMEQLEARRKKKPHRRDDDEEEDAGANGQSAYSTVTTKLTLDDLVGLESLTSTTAAPTGLIKRSARTEEGELAEQYLFSDETSVITTNDVLRGKSTTKEVALTSLLDMGSPDEQSTWITRARALRELGLARKAQETLIEGCAVTGKKGTLIWEERLRHVSAVDKPLARRRLLEEATAACPYAEKLWLERIDMLPPPQRLACVQEAVLACPTSETLWLRVVDVTPSVDDQRKLIRRAVQRSPNQPRLWAKLARLVPYEAGKDIFRQVGHQHASLELALEATKFVEDQLSAGTSQATPAVTSLAEGATATAMTEEAATAAATAQRVFERLRTADGFKEMSDQAHVAQQRYLDVSTEWSRQAWLALTKEAATGMREDDDVGALSPSSSGAPPCSHVWTAAFFILYCARPQTAFPVALPHPMSSTDATVASPNDVPLSATWIEDLLSFLPGVMEDHAMLSAVCGAFVLQLLPSFFKASPWPELRVPSTALDAQDRWESLLKLLRRALEVAPTSELRFVADGVCARAAGRTDPSDGAALSKGPNVRSEEEEEELGRPVGSGGASSSAQAKSTEASAALVVESRRSPLLSVLLAIVQTLLQPFTITYGAYRPITDTEGASRAPEMSFLRGTAMTEAAVLQSRLALVVASGFRARGEYAAALTILEHAEVCLLACMDRAATPLSTAPANAAAAASDVRLRLADQTRLEDGLVHVLVACAACHEHLDHTMEVSQYLSRGATQCPNVSSDVAWVGLLLHLRSRLGTDPADCGDVEREQTRRTAHEHYQATLQEALQAHPRSATLWRMRLSLAAQAVREAKASSANGAAEPNVALLSRLTVELRQICQRALSAAHCRTRASLWAYVAVTIEATLLGAVPAARALLAEAMTVCCPGRHTALSSSASPADKRAQHARAFLGLALARVELHQGGGREPAHEVVADTLRLLPKTKEGAFLLSVGELQQLYVDLEVPAQRGRAAMQVVQQWKSREPLALVAVAKLYHLAKHYDRALTEAIKAVKMSRISVMSHGSGSCYHTDNALAMGVGADNESEEMGRSRAGARGARDRQNTEDDLAVLPLSLSAYYHVHSHEQSDVLYADPLVLLWKLASLPEYAKAVATRMGTFSDEALEAVTTLSEEVVRDWVFSVAADALRTTAPFADADVSSTTSSDAVRQDVQRAALARLVPNAGPVWLAVTEEDEEASVLPSSCVSLIGYRQDTETLLRKAMSRLTL